MAKRERPVFSASDRNAVLAAIRQRGPETVDVLARATRLWNVADILKVMVADGTLVREVVIDPDCVRRATFRLPCDDHAVKLTPSGDVRCDHCGKRWVE